MVGSFGNGATVSVDLTSDAQFYPRTEGETASTFEANLDAARAEIANENAQLRTIYGAGETKPEERLHPISRAISVAMRDAVKTDVPVDPKYRPLLKYQVVAELLPKVEDGAVQTGRVTLKYTVPTAAMAQAIVTDLGPMDVENRLTDSLGDLPNAQNASAHAYGTQVLFDVWWEQPRPPNEAAVLSAMNTNFASVVKAARPGSLLLGFPNQGLAWSQGAEGRAVLTFKVTDGRSNRLDAAAIASLVDSMPRGADLARAFKLPAFVKAVTATAKGESLEVEATF